MCFTPCPTPNHHSQFQNENNRQISKVIQTSEVGKNEILSLHLLYTNARGLRSKIPELYQNVLSNNYGAILITETWLTSSHKNSELIDQRYVIYRSDRCELTSGKKRGGGVLLAVHKNYNSWLIDSPNLGSLVDCVLVKIQLNNSSFIHLCLVYITPGANSDVYKTFFSVFR